MAIIALTASAFEEQRADITSIGCDDFLRKPFRPEEIFGMLSKHTGVRYIDVPTERTAQDTVRPETLKSALNSLPADLLALLTEGVELGDMGMIDRAVREIDTHAPELAGSLAQLMDRFEYDVLLNLVKEPID
jgi:CheY-like chemotaxis protein